MRSPGLSTGGARFFEKTSQSLINRGVSAFWAAARPSTWHVDNLVDSVEKHAKSHPQAVETVDNFVDKCG